ncbi:hypothetical protein ES703_118507 [subsurface metagenome]
MNKVKEKGHQTEKIAREVKQLEAIIEPLAALNPLPWLTVAKLIAPFVARIAIRYVLRKMSKTTSESNIELAVDSVRGILTRIGAKGEQNPVKTKKKG